MATFFCSPTGTSGNLGTINSPWSLAHVASGAGGAIQGGDVIRFLSGTYNITVGSSLFVSVNGTTNRPVMFMSHTGVGAHINGHLILSGNNQIWYNMRMVWYHDTIRSTNTPGSAPADVPRAVTGVNLILGQNVRLIECIVNDHAGGIFSNEAANNFQAIDNIFYNNGWTGPDRGHGHGFYCQNNGTTRHLLRGNIVWCNFSSGIKIGGTSGSLLLRFDVLNNASFNNQLPGVVTRGYTLDAALNHDGGSANKGDTTVVGNYFAQQHDRTKFALDIGDAVAGSFPVTITDNVLYGRTQIGEWPSITFRRNVLTDWPTLSNIVAADGLFRVKNTALYDIDQNIYATNQSASPFQRSLILEATGKNWTQWQAETTYDDASTFIDGNLSNALVRVVPAYYTDGKGYIYILNPQSASQVSVNLSTIVPFGGSYAIYHVYDYVQGNAPLVRGIYNGTLVNVPMTPKTPPQPFGGPALPQQDNTFGAFVVTPDPLRPYSLNMGI